MPKFGKGLKLDRMTRGGTKVLVQSCSDRINNKPFATLRGSASTGPILEILSHSIAPMALVYRDREYHSASNNHSALAKTIDAGVAGILGLR